MKKLSLELDALRVESFDTTAARAAGAGTVRGHSGDVGVEVGETVPNPVTLYVSCTCQVAVKTDLCSLGCSEGCSVNTCPTGIRACCV